MFPSILPIELEDGLDYRPSLRRKPMKRSRVRGSVNMSATCKDEGT